MPTFYGSIEVSGVSACFFISLGMVTHTHEFTQSFGWNTWLPFVTSLSSSSLSGSWGAMGTRAPCQMYDGRCCEVDYKTSKCLGIHHYSPITLFMCSWVTGWACAGLCGLSLYRVGCTALDLVYSYDIVQGHQSEGSRWCQADDDRITSVGDVKREKVCRVTVMDR